MAAQVIKFPTMPRTRATPGEDPRVTLNRFQDALGGMLDPFLRNGAISLQGFPVPVPTRDNDGQALLFDYAGRACAWGVAGSGSAAGLVAPQYKTNSFTAAMVNGLVYVVNATTGAIAVTLPTVTAASYGTLLGFKRDPADSSGNTITLAGANMIDGAATFPLSSAAGWINYVQANGANATSAPCWSVCG